eukprot:maker-scaffold320_size207635-snap-gene-0.7 protein:Tk09306 transcript:maker-scaffold320_size207635-snap-gene-0.7-mRNA-1 annotation:"hypothetical protein Y032_0088g2123"
MNTSLRFILVGTFLVAAISQAWGILCYTGPGEFDAESDTPMSQTNCSGTNYCVKSYTGVSIAAIISRSCGSTNTTDEIGCRGASAGVASATTCHCNTDLCNGSEQAKPILGLCFAALAMILAGQN